MQTSSYHFWNTTHLKDSQPHYTCTFILKGTVEYKAQIRQLIDWIVLKLRSAQPHPLMVPWSLRKSALSGGNEGVRKSISLVMLVKHTNIGNQHLWNPKLMHGSSAEMDETSRVWELCSRNL